MFEKFRQRSYELENIDKGTYTPEEYEGCILELQLVNEWLGDAKALRGSLLKEIERQGLRSFSILDVGSGSGELLRVVAKWARETDRTPSLIGLELNQRSAQAILEQSAELSEITSVQGSGLVLPFPDAAIDYVMSSLTLHHFDDEGAVNLLREMGRVARRGVFVIDLHRNPMDYFFYTTVAHLFLHNRLIREDGALSILKSFTPDELEQLGRQAGLNHATVAKHFPSRLVLSAGKDSSESRL
jgi:ubiquinone/menaquinone biosynthesis C-methylase UbiE